MGDHGNFSASLLPMSYALGESSILCVFVFNEEFCKDTFDEEIAVDTAVF